LTLEINNWIFHVDIGKTALHSKAEAAEHCTCAYCRNFYDSVDEAYPQLRSFLSQFGLCLEAPDELIPLYPPSDCSIYYAVSGEILQNGNEPLSAGSIAIWPLPEHEASANTFLEGPHFFLHISCLQLPWVLSEPIEDVESTANDPAFLRDVFERFTGSKFSS